MWSKNESKGKVDQVKGKVKQAVGTLTGNDRLKAGGKVDQIVGKVEVATGRAGRRADAAVGALARAAKR